MNLYQDTNRYLCHHFNSREEWLDKRIKGIGGSDASVLVGLNPYKTNDELWKEKKGISSPKEISNASTEHGIALEPILREWFRASNPEYEVQYQENVILQSEETTWRLYSPDGLLYHKKFGAGIFEAKTTLIQNANMLQQWNDQIPQHYYIQILHGLLTTKFNYVFLIAELRFAWDSNKTEIRKYFIKKEEVLDDLKWLEQQETHNYTEFYIKDKEPPMILFL